AECKVRVCIENGLVPSHRPAAFALAIGGGIALAATHAKAMVSRNAARGSGRSAAAGVRGRDVMAFRRVLIAAFAIVATFGSTPSRADPSVAVIGVGAAL